MDGALAELMVKELADARATIEALNVKVAKLRKARPSANSGSSKAPETQPPADYNYIDGTNSSVNKLAEFTYNSIQRVSDKIPQ